MNTAKWIIAAGSVASVALAGCAAIGDYQPPTYRVPKGSQVELIETLRFPGRSARVHLQYGEAVPRKYIDDWQPHCSFGLDRTRNDEPLVREVPPTVFTVRKSLNRVEIAANPDGEALMVADLFGNESPGGPPWPYRYSTIMELYSEAQPQVDDLTCTVFGNSPQGKLTRDEIANALGGIARIR